MTDATTRAVNVLDDAIDALERQSGAWQSILQSAMDKLTDEAQSTVRNEIANVASRSIAQAGVEFRCNADFVGDRVRQALIRIRAELLNQPVPPVKPGFCNVVPCAVDRESVPQHVKQLEFYGYDFDKATNLRVFLHRSVGPPLDVTHHLDRPTHYLMTLKFGGQGVQLDERSERFVLMWDGEEISTVAVIQPQTPVCESRLERFTPQAITYVPPHTPGGGDREFDGHGPRVTATVTLMVAPQALRARVSMTARETQSDWTTAAGSKEFPLFSSPPGWRIESVVGPSATSHTYTDSDHDMDSFGLGSGGPVKRMVFVGDTAGDEAGTRTQVEVDFNELQIVLTQTTNCVPASSVRQLHERGLIGLPAYERLRPAMLRQLERQRSPARGR